MRVATSVLLTSTLCAVVACASLGFGGGRGMPSIEPPTISIAEIRLAKLPSNRALAGHYCAQYLSPLICRPFGPPTAVSDLQFAFDIELEFRNGNAVPLPIVQSLFAFTAFPDESSAANLGTVCLTFCEDPSDCRQDADGCVSDDPEVRDARDFARAATGFLYSVAVGDREFHDLRVRTVPPNDETRVVVRLGLDPTQTVDLIRNLGAEELERIKRGEMPKLSIPYELEGTAWVSVESFARIASSFGPARGEWPLR